MSTPRAGWVRREFGAPGVTQYEPGPHLGAITDQYSGYVLLCLDVSPSMEHRLREAVAGGLDFLDEAEQAGYRCGLILWDKGVHTHLRPGTDLSTLRSRLRRASLGWGTDLTPALKTVIRDLGDLGGDRVVCVFGDGDVGNRARAARHADRARALGIRFVVRGFGRSASANLSGTLKPDERGAGQTIESVSDLRQGIASMAASLRITR